MTNKDLNKFLKQLEDYNPQVKPNWEAFIAENESRLEFTDKTIEQSSAAYSGNLTLLKSAAIIFTIVTGIFLFWYFSGNESNVSSKQSENIQNIEVQVESIDNAAIMEINIENVPVESDQSTINQPLPNPTDFLGESDSNPQSMIDPADQNTAEIKITDSDNNEISTSVEENHTVIIQRTDTIKIRKTILVADTVKIKKSPLK